VVRGDAEVQEDPLHAADAELGERGGERGEVPLAIRDPVAVTRKTRLSERERVIVLVESDDPAVRAAYRQHMFGMAAASECTINVYSPRHGV
jgi:hypothetical protein